MRTLLTAATAAVAAFALGVPSADTAAADPVAGPVRAAIYAKDDPAVFEKAQVYFYFGHRYCWYWDGWQGPGWYWCGYAWRRGWGWGGPYGWRGWHGGGPRHGYYGHPHWNRGWNGHPGWNGRPHAYARRFNGPSHNVNGPAHVDHGMHDGHPGGPGGHGHHH